MYGDWFGELVFGYWSIKGSYGITNFKSFKFLKMKSCA